MEWAHVAIYLTVVLFISGAMVFGGHLLHPKSPNAVKGEPYECGVPILAETRERFSVRFYLVAIMFILFDIETVFLIPWGTIFFGNGGPSMGFLLIEMLVFVGVLLVGYIYVWKRGAFEWD